MERLTKRLPNGKAVIDVINLGGVNRHEAVVDRLAELEDEIENGTLVKLPCKIGDTVCKFHSENGKITGGVAAKVKKIEINRNGTFIYTTAFAKFRADNLTIGDITKPYIDTERYYICTREEAEKRLEELRG